MNEKDFDLIQLKIFEKNGYMGMFRIDLLQKMIFNCDAIYPTEHLCTEEEFQDIEEWISECGFLQWQVDHKVDHNTDPRSGMPYWEVELKRHNCIVKRLQGQLIAPERWDCFEMLYELSKSLCPTPYRAPFPDLRFYSFTKTIRLSASELLHKTKSISPGRRVKLVHTANEVENADGINVKYSFGDFDPYILCHIPSSLAAELITAMQWGAIHTGWIRSCTDDEILLDVYQRELCPPGNLNRILFWTGGYDAPDTFLEIIFPARQMIYKVETGSWSRKFRKTTLTFSAAQWHKNVLPPLQKCNLPAWHKHYVNVDVLDGEQWEMELQFDNEEIISSCGSNDYPEEWDLWGRFMKHCLALQDVQKTEETEIREKYSTIKDFG